MHATSELVAQRTLDALRGQVPDLVERFRLLCAGCEQHPDLFAFLNQVQPSRQELIDLVRLDQCLRWQAGRPLRGEEYLHRLPLLASDTELALQVIYHEFLLCRDLGQHPKAQDYLDRFPEHAEALGRQLELDRALCGPSTVGFPVNTRAQTATKEELVPPCRLGRYFLVHKLGEGGQAVIYRGIHPLLGRDVVVKLARQPPANRAGLRAHLLTEGRALAELDHPNLARVHDLDVHEGRPFLVLEYVRGRNLMQYTEDRPIPPRQAALLVAALARAVAVVHRRGLVHRDIKPGNVLIDESDRPGLIDFGLARFHDTWHEEAGEPGLQGTPAFMAPEQARGEGQVGPGADVFALGGLLYYLLTGEPPFHADDPYKALALARACAWGRSHPRWLAAPRRLRAITARALAAQPGDRYARADDLARALEHYVRAPGVPLLLIGLLFSVLFLIGWLLGRL